MLYSLANLVLDLASVINFIALLLMLRAVIKNRKVLRGYSIVGSFLTFVSIVGFEVAYYLLGNISWFRFGVGYSGFLVHRVCLQPKATIEGRPQKQKER